MITRCGGRLGSVTWKVLGPVVFLLWLQAPDAQAGFCAGDRDRFRVRLERLGYDLHMLSEQARILARHFVLTGRDALVPLGLWMLHWRARQRLAQSLEAGGAPPGARELVSLLLPDWRRSVQLRRAFGREADPVGETLEQTVRQVLAAEVGCRAVRSADVGPCQVLAELAPRTFNACREDTLLLGVIYSHRCDGAIVEPLAEQMQLSADGLAAYCRVLAAADPAGCAQVPGLPDGERGICRALATLDAGACATVADAAEDPGRAEACRRQVLLHRSVRGGPLRWSRLRGSHVGAVEFSHLVAARDPSASCARVSLLVYDILAARFFDLDTLLGLPVPRTR